MIYVQWLQVDWFTIQLVLFALLTGLIIILRLIRRFTRWREVKTSEIRKEVVQSNRLNLTKYFPPFNNSSHRVKENRILFISPLSYFSCIRYYLPQSLSLLGFEVFLLSSKEILQTYHKSNNNNIKMEFGKIIKDLSIKHIIIFDWVIPLILKELMREKDHVKTKNLNIIFVRPTFSWKNVKRLWNFVPFSSRWIQRLILNHFPNLLRLDLNVNPSHNSYAQKNLDFFQKNEEFLSKHTFLIINSEKSWLSASRSLEMNDILSSLDEKFSNFHYYQFTKGGWTFYRQETLLFGLIARDLRNFN